jgi:anti-anti-sigma factor
MRKSKENRTGAKGDSPAREEIFRGVDRLITEALFEWEKLMPKLVQYQGTWVLEMPRDLDRGESLLARMDDVLVDLTTQTPQVVVDLTASPYLPGSVLGLLVRHLGQVRKRGGRMVVVSTPMQREVFELTQIERLVTLTSSRDEALSVLAASA